MRVVRGRCWEGGGAPSFLPWVDVLRSLILHEPRERERHTALAPEIAQLIPELSPETVLPRTPSDPMQARFRLFDAVATLLKQFARSVPLLIILDDLHEADHSSLELLEFVARGLTDSRIVIVGTHRDAEVRSSPRLSEAIGEILRHGHAIPLAGLDQDEVTHIVEHRAQHLPSAAFASELHRVTAGNPLFVDGVIRVLLAERKLGTSDRIDLRGFKLPEDVRGAIRKRLGLLSAQAQSTLATAAVVGQEFETALLERITNSSSETTAELMGTAAEMGVVVLASQDSYRFTHPLIREALYKDSTESERMRLHRATGEALEQMHAANLTPHLAALAHHFGAAGVVDKAIDYSIRAGEAAYAVFAYDRATSDFKTALELIERHEPHSPLLARVLFSLGSLTLFLSDIARGVAQLESALEVYKEAGDELRVAEIHSLLGLALGAFNPHMDVTRALSHFERAEPVLGRTAETLSLGVHYWGLAIASFEALRIDEALAASERAIEIFNRLGDERWSSVTGNHCQSLMLKGKHAEARALLEKILLEATRLKDPGSFRQVIFSCGWYFMLMREPRRAINIYRSGLKRKDLNTFQRALLSEFLASAEVAAGNLKEATAITHEIKVNPTFRSQIAFYGGDWDSAGELLQEHIDWARNASSAWNELNSLSLLMENLRVKGDFDGAMSCFDRARGMFGPDNQYWEVRLRSRAVFLFVDTDWTETALEHLQYCRAILAQGEDWLGYTGTLRRGEAMIAASIADFGEADRHFASAVEINKQYSLPWDEAETLHYWGKSLTLAGEHSRATEKFDAAIEIYRRHGAGQRWIDRVEADRNTGVSLSGATSDNGIPPPIFRKEGEYWKTAFEGGSANVRERGGMRFIAMLLARPGEEIPAIEMFSTLSARARGRASAQDGLGRSVDLGDAGEEFDARALSEYRRRRR